MSEENTSSCCASCGIAEVDDIKLKECDGCDLVKYCSDECLTDHKSQREEACKKRATELRDELLFKQPESSYLGDCPICFLPLPLDPQKTFIYECCSKVICMGCDYANDKREAEMRLKETCPFCRKPMPKTIEEGNKLRMKRVEANDPIALREEGHEQNSKGDHRKAFERYTQAAELGDAKAHFNLAFLYNEGEVVEEDFRKEVHHLEEAAIRGYPEARYNLGYIEWRDNGNTERAVKHFIIAASQGFDGATKELIKMFKEGYVSKEVLAATLRAHQAAVDETKSPQRHAAEESYRNISNM